jgi:hypothetical protein
MSRTLKVIYVSVLTVLLVTFVTGGAAPKDAPKPEAKAEEPIHVKLTKVVTFNGLEDPKTSLAEQLEILGSRHNLVFDINDRAFVVEGLQDVAKTLVGETPIAPMKNVRLETVLRKVLARVASPSGATYTIRRDRVEITTNQAQQQEFWPNAPEGMEPYFPLVHATFDKTPLDEALKDLAERSDVTIVLDVKAAEKLKPVVTAHLANTPLDTAVQLLAEMSDLRSVAIGKTLFVTTSEKAKRLYKQAHPPMPNGGFGALGLAGAMGQLGVGALGQFGQLGAGALGQFGQLGVGALGQFGQLGVGGAAPGNFRPRTMPGAGM